MVLSKEDLAQEFDRQVQVLIDKEYPALAKISKEDFVTLFSPLKEKVTSLLVNQVDLEQGYLPFVIVLTEELISAEEKMAKTELKGKVGITKLFPHESTDFSVIEKVSLPSSVYLLVDIDRGKDSLNIAPEDAFKLIEQEDRSVLTIDEGIAVITMFPEFLMKNNCFSLLGSRNPSDQRVPAIWINASKQPNLGWCWDRNPHTWLGSASAKERIS